jgi:hypothetical protein
MVLVLPPTFAPRPLKKGFVPGIGLKRARKEHARPDFLLAEVLAVSSNHGVHAQVLLHFDNAAHRVVNLPRQHLVHRFVFWLQFADERQAEPTMDRYPVGNTATKSDAGPLCGFHLRVSSG